MAQLIPQKKVEYAPKCPHCEREMREIDYRQMKTQLYAEYLYMCPHCHKVIGIAAAAH
jgi:uncharacterized protein with PIN domain